MIVDLLFLLVSATCWLGAAHRARGIRRAENRAATGALVAALACLGAATFMQVRDVWALVDHITGVPTTAKLLGHVFTLVTAYAAQTILVTTLISSRTQAMRRTRRRAVVLVAALAVMVALVLATPDGQKPIRPEDGVIDANWAGTVYVLVYSLYLGAANADICRMGFRYSRLADRPFLKLGMLLIAFGTAIGTIYAAGKAALVFGRLIGVESSAVEYLGLGPMVLAAAALVAVGSALPALSAHSWLHPPVRWLLRMWTHTALRPLWAQLVRSASVPRLLPTTWRTVTGSGLNLPFLLQRRVTEISDGLLQLRGYVDPQTTAVAERLAAEAGLQASERRAVVEAAGIVAALRARRAGRTAQHGSPQSPPFSDLDSKAWWLHQVAWAMRRSPVVRAATTLPVPTSPVSDGAAP